MNVVSAIIATPIGAVRVEGNSEGIASIAFVRGRPSRRIPPSLRQRCRELREYFAGERQTFSRFQPATGTSFQKKVWEGASEIQFGNTESYGSIGARLGTKAARAVGTALGSNPLAIVVPCHRVVPAHGGVGGYAWGEWRKEWLLKLEALSSKL